VRIERRGALPARCVVCNEPARRSLPRSLYWSPVAWRVGALLTPFALLIVGIFTGTLALLVLFWPAVIVLTIAHLFVRTKLAVELPLCERHWRGGLVVRGLSIAAVVAVLVVVAGLTRFPTLVLPVLSVAVIAFAIAQGFIGAQRVALKRVDPEHAWLGGMGRPFREALPELPGA